MSTAATDATFQADVVERSRQRPVIVDFWAAWCGPCRSLAPVLERAVEAHAAEVDLVKVDVDAHPRLAATYRVQGIPAVKAFRNGHVVDEFTGAQPPSVVEAFIQRLVPSEADALVDVGDEASLRRAVELEPRRADARIALSRLLLARGERADAYELLRPVEHAPAAAAILARAELEADADASVQVHDALAQIERGEAQEALELLLEAVAAAEGPTRERIRRVMVGIFGELGDQHELTLAYRRQLAMTLY